jgi:dTDP-N-acetylfucosamine:lipid II N-acetylfucosaminyltransferase
VKGIGLKKMYVHVAMNDKFIPPFIDFINDNLEAEKHVYFVFDRYHDLRIEKKKNIVLVSEFKHLISAYLILMRLLHSAKKIIIHGMWDRKFNWILFAQPWLMKKSYWMMWGGDFYYPEQQGWIKKMVIKRIQYLVTGATGDYMLVKNWYGAIGRHIKCFNYPSNIYKEHKTIIRRRECVNIQVGNSADPSNNHTKVFEQLSKFKNANIKIYVPLSYGNKEYANSIINKGNMLFGDKFIPLTKFIPIEEYLEYLLDIDIAIFAHNRQQAMGNITTLLGYGKKVYLSKVSTLNGVFREFKIKTYDVDNIDLKLLDSEVKDQNIRMIKSNFSKQSLLNGLKIFLS